MKLNSKILLWVVAPLCLIGLIIATFTLLSKKVNTDLDVMKNETIYYSRIAKNMNLDVVKVQQWLTDISATRALDGLNDGFDMASESADKVLNGLNQFKEYYKQRGDSAGTAKVMNIIAAHLVI